MRQSAEGSLGGHRDRGSCDHVTSDDEGGRVPHGKYYMETSAQGHTT